MCEFKLISILHDKDSANAFMLLYLKKKKINVSLICQNEAEDRGNYTIIPHEQWHASNSHNANIK